MQTILTITGSDGSGGSGLQADIRCISELGGTATSAITSITVQNTLGIQEFYDLPASTVRTQIEAILNDLQPQVVKIGLLRRIDVVQVVAELMRKYRPKYIVYAPVLHSTRGDLLVAPQVYSAIKEQLIPLCTIVLEPSDLPSGTRQHGHANQLAAALAYYLSSGESVNEAMLHARSYVSMKPKGYTEDNSRSGELYNLFLSAIDRFYNRYSDGATRCQCPLFRSGHAQHRPPLPQSDDRRTYHLRDHHPAHQHQQAPQGDCHAVGFLLTSPSVALLQEAEGCRPQSGEKVSTHAHERIYPN